MTSTLNAQQTLEREYFAMRAKVLELAASFDRIQRSDGEFDTERWKKLQQSVRILLEESEGRAEKVQLLFSREYSEQWREKFGIGK